MPFPPSAACRFFDLPPVNLQNLPLHLTKNSFASAPTHLCGIALIEFNIHHIIHKLLIKNQNILSECDDILSCMSSQLNAIKQTLHLHPLADSISTYNVSGRTWKKYVLESWGIPHEYFCPNSSTSIYVISSLTASSFHSG